MRTKSFVVLFLLAALLLNACSYKNEAEKTSTNLVNEPETGYTDELLKEIVKEEGTFAELTKRYSTEYVHELENSYRVLYYGESFVAVMIFDLNGNKLTAQLYRLSKSKSLFDDLQTGDSITDVQSLDPDGEYLFLYTGRNDVPRVSAHYTADKYLIEIMYDENNVIAKIKVESM